MNVEFNDDDLRKLLYDAQFTGGFPREVVKAFRKRLQFIMSATDERDFYAMKSLHYEKLKGGREGERSMRLNEKYRLILSTIGDGDKRGIVILAIEDYH